MLAVAGVEGLVVTGGVTVEVAVLKGVVLTVAVWGVESVALVGEGDETISEGGGDETELPTSERGILGLGFGFEGTFGFLEIGGVALGDGGVVDGGVVFMDEGGALLSKKGVAFSCMPSTLSWSLADEESF